MRSMKEIFYSYGVLDPQGRHVNGTDKETNHHYGDAYEGLFAQHDINLCTYPSGWQSRYCNLCGSDTSHFVTCPHYKLTRDGVHLMLEVGVADGSSLCAWREIFPNALCVGLDIHHSDKAHGERIEFHLGDATSQHDCERAAGGRQFDLIVDDAMHHIMCVLPTLLFLWPYIRPGGLYVVEEFEGINSLRPNVTSLFPFSEIVETTGPSGGCEPLVVF